jgi:hypothetical protein
MLGDPMRKTVHMSTTSGRKTMKDKLKRVIELTKELAALSKDVEAELIREAWSKVDEPSIPADVLMAMRELTFVHNEEVRVRVPFNYVWGDYQGVRSYSLTEALDMWYGTTGYYCSEDKTESQRHALKRAFTYLAFDRYE